MNLWLAAAIGLSLGLFPCGWICLRGSAINRLVGLETANAITILLVILLAEGFQRPSLYDLALALALLAFPSGMVFAHFLERWL